MIEKMADSNKDENETEKSIEKSYRKSCGKGKNQKNGSTSTGQDSYEATGMSEVMISVDEGQRDGAHKVVKCFCGIEKESGEMVECEVCAGWYHLKCLKMREGIGLLEGKSFVCCFCLATKVLSLSETVIELQNEVRELRMSLDSFQKGNDGNKSGSADGGREWN